MSALTAPYDPTLPTDEDFRSFSDTQPAPVSQAPPPKASAGLDFDFDAFRAKAEQVGYAGLSQPERALIDQLAAGVAPSRENMAKTIMQEQARIREQSTPQAQAQAQSAKLSAQKTKLDIEKLEKEKISAAKDSAEVATRKQLIFDKIDKYTNPQNPKYTPLNALVGKWDGTAGALLDASGVNDKRAAQRAELDRLVSSDILELTKFLKPIAGTDLEFLRSMVPKIHQNDTIWTDYLTDSKKVLEAMTAAPAATQQAPAPQAAPQAAPAQPQQPATRVIGGRTFIQQPNGNWIPR